MEMPPSTKRRTGGRNRGIRGVQHPPRGLPGIAICFSAGGYFFFFVTGFARLSVLGLSALARGGLGSEPRPWPRRNLRDSASRPQPSPRKPIGSRPSARNSLLAARMAALASS